MFELQVGAIIDSDEEPIVSLSAWICNAGGRGSEKRAY
jgi:hypothetical protein